MKFLNALSLTDRQGHLSLTNLALLLLLIRIVFVPGATVVDLGALFLAVLNYGHKRYQNAQVPAEVDLSPVHTRLAALEATKTDVAKIIADVSTIKTAIALKPTR